MIGGLLKTLRASRYSVASAKREAGGRILGLQWQITLAVALGLMVVLGTFAAIAYFTITQSTNAALKERQAIAIYSAETIDHLIRHVARQLETVATLPALRQSDVSRLPDELSQLLDTMATVETLALVDANSGKAWAASVTGPTDGAHLLADTRVIAALRSGQTRVTHASPVHIESGHPALCTIVVPVDSAEPNVQRALVGELHLRAGEGEVLPLPQLSNTGASTIIDNEGAVLATTNGDYHQLNEEHVRLLAEFRASGNAGVAIHTPPTGKSHVVAFAPFQTMSGGVIVEDREDVVLAVPQQLRRNLILYGSLTVVLVSVLAWLHAWRTMRPIRKLTSASQAIAGGVLDRPVRIFRKDEIGVLAQSFEAMRQQLLDIQQERLRWEQEMESRVTERTEQVHTLLARVISAQEEERKRVARELHDQVAQDLATTVVTLQRLAQSTEGLKESDRANLEQARRRLGETLKEMRRMISDLRPSALDDLGLEAAVRGYCESRAATAGLRVHLETSGEASILDGPRQTALFRIVQEAITNVVRHAGARNLFIRLEFSKDGTMATVGDDGKGFDLSALGPGPDPVRQLGILGMKERAALLNGKVEVDARPGRGTIVKAWIPAST